MLDEGEDVGQDLAGWNSLVSPLMTGTRECAAKVSMRSCPKVRIITRSTMRLMTRAVSSIGSARPSWLSPVVRLHHAAAQLVHAGLKTHPRAGGGLLEDHGQRAVGQRVVLS